MFHGRFDSCLRCPPINDIRHYSQRASSRYRLQYLSLRFFERRLLARYQDDGCTCSGKPESDASSDTYPNTSNVRMTALNITSCVQTFLSSSYHYNIVLEGLRIVVYFGIDGGIDAGGSGV